MTCMLKLFTLQSKQVLPVTPPLLGPDPLTSSSSLVPQTIITDQHMSFTHTLFSLIYTHPRRTSRSATHLKIAPNQLRLTSEFFRMRFRKKLQLVDINFLSILSSLGTNIPVGQPQARDVPSWLRPYVQCRCMCYTVSTGSMRHVHHGHTTDLHAPVKL